jgi:adenylate cyclase
MRNVLAAVRGIVAGRTAAAAVAVYLALLLIGMLGLPAYEAARERAIDTLIAARGGHGESAVVVVDIDRRSLDLMGPWPWSREQLAALVERIASAEPAAIGLDILIEAPDERSPAALARRLGTLDVPADLAERLRAESARLTDGDARLASALQQRPSVLGIALLPADRVAETPPPPILMQTRPDIPGLWRAEGVATPPKVLAESVRGLGVIAALGDSDGRVRQVPLLAAAGGALWPGLALDLVRVGQQAGAYVVTADGRLRIGNLALALPRDALLRLDPVSTTDIETRTIAAADVLAGRETVRLAGKMVLIGSSAPEAGGLRTASFGALQPSVQLQAAAVAQLMSGRVPLRPVWLARLETAALLTAGLGALLLARASSPIRSGVIILAAGAAWITGAFLIARAGHVLIDPIAVPAALIGSFAIAVLFTAAIARRRADALRRRFEQHLAPELVRRLAESPDLVKLSGEEREVTILFTDIEGFTSMTERSEPNALIRALDRYLEGATGIVVTHGGMVEKIVGDGLHALFNAPLDLADHPSKAVDCARALHEFSEAFRLEPEIAALGFGRTRIGIETGTVILGDVGGGSKLDYTAYGNAMNLTARLEAANKELGTTILVGEAAAGRLGGASALRPLGSIAIRGRSAPVAIYEPWPKDMGETEREAFVEAFERLRGDEVSGLTELKAIAADRPHDTALRRLVERLERAAASSSS